MSDIYTGIDLGTDGIKIVVCEKIHVKYCVLASVVVLLWGLKMVLLQILD